MTTYGVIEMTENEAAVKLFENITALWKPWVIFTAVQLKLAETVSTKSMTTEQLAEVSKTHASTLHRLMRALASLGIFKLDDDQKWTMTPMSQVLAKWTHVSNMYTNDLSPLWSKLTETVKTGLCPFEKVFGENYWQYLISHQKEANNLTMCLQEYNEQFSTSISEYYDFKPFKNIVDLGGNKGVFLSKILESAPDSTGIVLDQKEVIDEAINCGVSNRITFVVGNVLEKIPEDGDLYILKQTFLIFDDDEAETVISNISIQMKQHSRLLIIEPCMPEDNATHVGYMSDLLFFMICGTKQRTKGEFERILNKFKLRVNRIITTNSPMDDIIEVVFQ
ncbi:hypothetical protein B4U80_11961 [Leptotrombidium deliense]|uniref:Acetylserotonin O-methyltransferase n=1 Tax=Leptotrombidium deliense TaxID=299467 RepID=A0A443S0H8_9ACAR|nr:hypothetical protein B4U80_11961 [Leptotrombidium deliense]